MLLTYYTLTSLAADWNAVLVGATVVDVYSQQRDELSITLGHPGGEASTLVVVARSGQRVIFRNRGRGRRSRNTASLLEAATGSTVSAVRTAHRDRIVFLDLGDVLTVQIVLFGPRPNVWLVDRQRDVVVDSFSAPEEWEGKAPPAPRPAPAVSSFEEFDARWPGAGTLHRAVSRAMPFFDSILAEETIARADVRVAEAAELAEPERRVLFEQAVSIEAELARPAPRIYWRGRHAEAFALLALRHLEARGLEAEAFTSVDEAVRVFGHRLLAQERFDARYRPLSTRLRRQLERLERGLGRMRGELESPSRADTYERFAHLLVAQAAGDPAGREEVTLPDIMGDGAPVTIALDPALSPIQNAQRYYERARRARAARAHAEERLVGLEEDARRMQALLAELEESNSAKELDALIAERADELDDLLGSGADAPAEPFRRFPLPGGFEAWVGRNARANAELTTRHARPHDIWLHARGVPGSHVVIRRSGREAPVPRPALEAAARLAAYFSRARTSALVPVQVTERKYVRPIKGGPPGAVRLDREEVLLVEPSRGEGGGGADA